MKKVCVVLSFLTAALLLTGCSAFISDLFSTEHEDTQTTTEYTVHYYLQDADDDDYVEDETSATTATTADDATAAESKAYEGFTSQNLTTATSDGKTTITIYYVRNTVTVTFDLAGGTTATPFNTTTDAGGTFTGRYGATLSIKSPTLAEKLFEGWQSTSGTVLEAVSTFPLANETYTAQWSAIPDATCATALYYNSKVQLSWTNPSFDTFAGVAVYSGSTKLATVDSTLNYYSCTDSTYAAEGKTFTLKTVDASGTESGGNEITAYSTTLPVLEIDTNNVAVVDKVTKVPGTMKITDSTYPLNSASLTIKGRGNSTWSFPKKSYTIKLDSKASLLSMNKGKSFALVANYCDKTLLRNQTAYYMGRTIYTNMDWNPDDRQVQFYLNNSYLGIYLLCETNKIDSKRVSIESVEDKGSSGGYLLEVNKRLDETLNFTTSRGVCFSLKDPDEYGNFFDESVWDAIQSHVQTVEDALYSDDFTDSTSTHYYRNYIDVDSFIDWYIVNEASKNNDAIFFSSCYMYYDPSDGLLHMGPLWDFDIGFGNVNYNGCDSYENYWIKYAAWISRMFDDETFVEQLKLRWQDKKTELDALPSTYIPAQAALLTAETSANFTAWPVLGTYIYPNCDGYADRTTYQSEVDYLTAWFTNRITWLDAAINDL